MPIRIPHVPIHGPFGSDPISPQGWDAANGFYWYDHFNYNASPEALIYGNTANNGGTSSYISAYGRNAFLKVVGSLELATGTTAAVANRAVFLANAGSIGGTPGPLIYTLGPLTWKTKIFQETLIPPTGIGYVSRFGIGQSSSTFVTSGGMGNVSGFWFEYSPDSNNGVWQATCNNVASGASYTPCLPNIGVTPDTGYTLQIDVNAAWTSVNFTINGILAATISTAIPQTGGGTPFFAINRNASSTVSFLTAIDYLYVYYPYKN